MKLQIMESNKKFKKDIHGWNFKYEIESISDKIINMLGISVNESNFGRIKQHIDNGCMMISACRGENTEHENTVATDSLAKDLKNSKLGYIRILGGYIENLGTDSEKEVTEESFFVPKTGTMSDNEFFSTAIKLCKKYNQDSVLISLPEYKDFGYYDKNGEFVFSPGEKFIANDKEIGSYFSQLVKGSGRNKRFAFQDIKVEWLAVRHPSNQIQATWMYKMNEYF